MRRLIFFMCVAAMLLPDSGYSQVQYIKTFAGDSGVGGCGGDGGLAIAASMKLPSGVAVGIHGDLYIADQACGKIRRVSATGIISTVAGNGMSGYEGDDTAATATSLNWPEGVAVDKYGNVYIADQYNNRIRKVDTNGIITTIAGIGGITGYSGDGGPATNAQLDWPEDVCVDKYGDVYFVDMNNQMMRKIDTNGIITRMAGCDSLVAGFGGDGGPATADSVKLNYPEGITCDTFCNIYIADFYNQRVRKVNAVTGVITTVAGGGTTVLGDGGPATSAYIAQASSVGIDRTGNLYITDYDHFTIRKVDTAGIITTIAGNETQGYSGDCGPATLAQLSSAQGVTVDSNGNVFVADFVNRVIREITYTPCLVTTAIQTASQATQLSIFPNPTSGQFTVQPSNNQLMYELEVYDMMGELLYERKTLQGQTEINFSGRPTGVYFVSIICENQVTVSKLVVSH